MKTSNARYGKTQNSTIILNETGVLAAFCSILNLVMIYRGPLLFFIMRLESTSLCGSVLHL